MTSFKNVSAQNYTTIVQSLSQKFNIEYYDTEDTTIQENFHVVVLGSKLSVKYYQNGTILIQGDSSIVEYRDIAKIIENTLPNK